MVGAMNRRIWHLHGPDCNAFKGANLTAMDPETDEVVSVFNPRE